MPSKIIIEFKNKIDFSLRNLIKFSRKGFYITPESKEGLFKGELLSKEKKYVQKYKLKKLKQQTSRRNYAENLYTLELLESFLSPKKQQSLKVLDIGSKNWFYANAEHQFFKKFAEKVHLDGIEIDPWRVYSNFYSRYDVAMFYISDLKDTNYITDDFLNHKAKYDYIIWILPFITQAPQEAWGLPKEYFKPKEMLQKAYKDLNTGGKMLIVNQGEKEFETQKRLYKELDVPYKDCNEFKSGFLSYKNKRFVSIVTKID